MNYYILGNPHKVIIGFCCRNPEGEDRMLRYIQSCRGWGVGDNGQQRMLYLDKYPFEMMEK